MALIKLGIGFSEIKGVIGGTKYQSYKGATMASTRISGGGRKTVHWNTVKVRFGNASRLWRALSPAQKTAWNEYAPGVSFTNKFGDRYQASGYQVFMMLNANLINAGFDPLTSPPTVVGNGDIDSGDVVDIIGMQNKRLSISGTYGEEEYFQVFASSLRDFNSISPASRYRLISQFPANTLSPPNLADAYRDVYGFFEPDLTSVWYKIRLINSETGFLSSDLLQLMHTDYS